MQQTETLSIQHSIEVILGNQAASGAYLASPSFPTYHYSWFRDGSFIAYAMALYGNMDSAERFHEWAVKTIARREDLIRGTVSKVARGEVLDGGDFLHTRYGVDGTEAPVADEEWPNHQLDGFGTWLWALAQYQQQSGRPLPDRWVRTAGLVGEYLSALWHLPCYDCWEEFPGDIHPHTLAAVYGGLKGLSALDGQNRADLLERIRDYVSNHAVYAGYFVKKIGSYTVDASLLGLALPYGLVELDDPRFIATVERIESSLRKGGGVHRYPTDTYFGGGEWVLLTAWLGWYYAQTGQQEKALETLHWIEAQADEAGHLPEQVAASLNDPNYYQPWVERWGPPANPLVWSHAFYLILQHALAN